MQLVMHLEEKALHLVMHQQWKVTVMTWRLVLQSECIWRRWPCISLCSSSLEGHSDNLAPSDAYGYASEGEGLASRDAAVAWKGTAITWHLVMHLVMQLEKKGSHLVRQQYLGR